MAAAQYSSLAVINAIMFDGNGHNRAHMGKVDKEISDVTEYATRRTADRAEIVKLVMEEYERRRRNEKRALGLPPSPKAKRHPPGTPLVEPIPFNL